jgi:hypothetical protein
MTELQDALGADSVLLNPGKVFRTAAAGDLVAVTALTGG